MVANWESLYLHQRWDELILNIKELSRYSSVYSLLSLEPRLRWITRLCEKFTVYITPGITLYKSSQFSLQLPQIWLWIFNINFSLVFIVLFESQLKAVVGLFLFCFYVLWLDQVQWISECCLFDLCKQSDTIINLLCECVVCQNVRDNDGFRWAYY